jgi:hypothetical protein
MPIVDETTTIADRRNSRLKSRAQVSDGSGRRFFAMQGLIFLLGQRVTMRGNDRVGVTGRTVEELGIEQRIGCDVVPAIEVDGHRMYILLAVALM